MDEITVVNLNLPSFGPFQYGVHGPHWEGYDPWTTSSSSAVPGSPGMVLNCDGRDNAITCLGAPAYSCTSAISPCLPIKGDLGRRAGWRLRQVKPVDGLHLLAEPHIEGVL